MWRRNRQRQRKKRQGNAPRPTSTGINNESAPLLQHVPAPELAPVVVMPFQFFVSLLQYVPSHLQTFETWPLPLPSRDDDTVPQNLDTTNNNEAHLKTIKKVPMKASKPEELRRNKKLGKFWYNRRYLFYKYDKGIELDTESWHSVTPEKTARKIAQHCQQRKPGGTVIDAFCGCGGNTIQFAKLYDKVIAIDIDPERIEKCKNNAAIYGVADKIKFICGDFTQLAPTLKADIVFLSPPWGGLSYKDKEVYDLEDMDGTNIFTLAKQITLNIVFYLPRNINRSQVKHLTGSDDNEEQTISIDEYDDNGRCRVVIAYFGELV